MHSPLKIKLTDLNPHLTCIICEGYFVNATTITECLHSFCRSCIVKYLETNKYCPICEVQIHKTKPLLNLRSDQTLQDIVYKLVPGLFQNEMQRRKTFYATNPSVTKPADPELSGELSERSYIYTSDDYISLSLEYYNNNNESISTADIQSRRYLRCPAAVSILHLQKLIRAKYGLTKDHKVDILYQNDALCEDFTLIDVAYIYLWKRKGPLHLTYRIFETECRKKVKYDFYKDEEMNLITDNIKTLSSIKDTDDKTLSLPPSTTSSLTSVTTTVLKTPEQHLVQDDITPQITQPTVTLSNQITDNNQTDQTNFLDNNLINSVSTSSVVTTLTTTDSNYLNNNNIKTSDKQLNEVVMCNNRIEPLPHHETTTSEDKEVHLQISETGIISITTSIASSTEITQTVTTTSSSSSSSSNTKLPITSNNNSSTTVIPNILRLKKSDLKSVRKNNAKTNSCGLIPPTSSTAIVVTTPSSISPSISNSSMPLICTTVESQTNERKRKLSTDSAENCGNSLKKPSVVVTQQVPLISDSNDMTLKSSKLITTCAPSNILPPTSILNTIASVVAASAATATSKSSTFNSKTTTIISPSIPKMSMATTASRKSPLINQQSITTPQIQPSIRPPIKQKSTTASGPKIQPPTITTTNPIPSKKPIGYKTLRNPPKAWNPTLPPRNLNHPYGGYIPNMESKLKVPTPVTTTSMSSSTNLVASVSIPPPLPTSKPNKFFKVRNNMPRYLGNPASGVKPMYQISSPATTTVVTTTSTPKPCEAKLLNPTLPNATTTSASSTTVSQSIKKTIQQPMRATSPVKSLTSIAGKLNTKTSTSQIPIKDTSILSKSTNETVTPPVTTESTVEIPVNSQPENTSTNDKSPPTNSIESNENEINKTENHTSKMEVPSSMTSTTDKVFQPSRNSLKLSLSSRNSTMTVSEMLQLRNSPKTTNPPQIQAKNEQKNSPSTDTVASVVSETNMGPVDEETSKKDEPPKENNIEEKVKPVVVAEDKKVNKLDVEKVTKEVEKRIPVVEEKVKESPHENNEQIHEKPSELKISQTTVPIYSPRFKQKNDSKFQKSINSNLRIDIHNETIENKLLYSPQVSPSQSQKIDAKKSVNKNVPSSPKFERVSSPKTLLISPKSPKTLQKSSPTLQINPIFDHKSKNQLSPQLDRMSPKMNQQIYKMSPTHTKQMSYEHKNSSKSGSSSSSTTDNSKNIGGSNTKSPTVKSVSQLSPKTLPNCKSDLNVPSQQKFNFVPANPFIPNLSSPNLSPNFLFSNYAISAAMSNYENRLLPQHNCPKNVNSILELSAYNIPLMNAMFYNQHRLGYPAPQTPGSQSCSLMGAGSPTGSSSSSVSAPITSTPSSIINTSATNSKSVDTKPKQSKDKNLNTIEKK